MPVNTLDPVLLKSFNFTYPNVACCCFTHNRSMSAPLKRIIQPHCPHFPCIQSLFASFVYLTHFRSHLSQRYFRFTGAQNYMSAPRPKFQGQLPCCPVPFPLLWSAPLMTSEDGTGGGCYWICSPLCHHMTSARTALLVQSIKLRRKSEQVL